jgi:hypothetical protein
LIEKELNPVLSYEDLQLDEVKKKNIIWNKKFKWSLYGFK